MVLEIDKRKKKVVLSLGGNIGDVKAVFKIAIEQLEKRIGGLVDSSSLYSTKAWGVENQPDFLNQIVVFYTELPAQGVLACCLDVEAELGRVRKEKWHERVIDIDVLFYADFIIDSKDLIVPHPYIQERNFILTPLEEIMPDFIHPKLEQSIAYLKKSCTDKLLVTRI